MCAVELQSNSSHSGNDHKYFLSALYDGGGLDGIIIQIPEFPEPICPIPPMTWDDDFNSPEIHDFSNSLFFD